jgi:hypothetical protein
MVTLMIPNKEYDLSIFTKEMAFRVGSTALERLISDVYSLPYFEATLESTNDTTHEFAVSKEIADWQVDEMKEFLVNQGCEHYNLGTVLNDMCSQGIIPEGKYYVRVCW